MCKSFRFRPAAMLKYIFMAPLALGVLVSSASVTFTNSMDLASNNSANQTPVLQFWPYYVDAKFDLVDPSNNLTITVYGNIVGNLDQSPNAPPLPPLDNLTYWNNPNETNGKIIDMDPSTHINTTLLAKYWVATNLAQSQPPLDFCSLTKQGCPLGPVGAPENNSLANLPQFTISQEMNGNFGFATIVATFIAESGDSVATQLMYVTVVVTPYLGDAPAALLRYIPVLILLMVAIATASAVFSPWGSWNIYAWTSNYGRDEDQLRLITPGFGDCLSYIQFVVFSGSLALSYPGFYQPAVSQASWSTLMFNESFVSHGPGINAVQDGVYTLNNAGNGTDSFQFNGLSAIRQLIGMSADYDIWAGFMVWLLVVLGVLLAIIQLGTLFRHLYRFATRTQEEDLREKNWPFSIGNVIRVVFNYFLLPLVTFCIFQLYLAGTGVTDDPDYLVALATITLVILLAFAGWLLYQILSTHPRSFLFDDLPTVLMYGPLYNTYSDNAAPFALVPILVNVLRGIAIGGIQRSGIAQIVVMAIAEVILLVSLNAFRPFSSPTSMNLFHTAFSVVRLVTLLLMVAFAHELKAPDGAKAWIGYVVLFLHGLVLFVGFFLHSLQTLIEVAARALGAGGEGNAATRGGLVKVFGVRQLSRRNPRRSGRATRGSMASDAAMLDRDMGQEDKSVRPDGMRSRSLSASSAYLLNNRVNGSGRQSLAMDTLSQGGILDAGGSSIGPPLTPATPSGAPSVFSYVPQGSVAAGANTSDQNSRRTSGLTAMTGAIAGQKPAEPADPYYRPPRTRRGTNDLMASPPGARSRTSWQSGDLSKRQSARQSGSGTEDFTLNGEGPLRESTGTPMPAYLGYNRARADSAAEDPDAPRPDYATREVDYYYGIRGPALNEQPTRRLKTGPADPTGPVSSAAGWFKNLLGGKSKDKHKGFEVVRGKALRQGMEPVPAEEAEISPREPYRDDPEASANVPAATTASRKLDLEDETDAIGAGTRRLPEDEGGEGTWEDLGIERSPEEAPVLPDIDPAGSIHIPSRIGSRATKPSVRYRDEDIPSLPRKSSQRHSGGVQPLSVDSSVGNRSQLPAIAHSPKASAHSDKGLSRMPFGSLAAETINRRPSMQGRAQSTASGVSDLSADAGDRRPSFQQPPSPIEPPHAVGYHDPRRDSQGSIGYVNQHRASDYIVTQAPIIGSSTAELVDTSDRTPSRSPIRAMESTSAAHVNF